MSNPDPKIEDSLTDVPASDEEYSLEEILAEYGGSLEQVLLRDTEAESGPQPEKASQLPIDPSDPQPKTVQPETDPVEIPASSGETPPPRKESPSVTEMPPEIPRPPRPVTLEEVVGSTVDAVMEEERSEPLLRPRRGLFSRRPLRETEELPGIPEPEPEPEVEPIGPEEEPREAAERYRRAWHVRRAALLPSVLVTLVAAAPLAAERYGLEIPLWTGDTGLQGAFYLACLLIQAFLCRHVFAKALAALARKRCVGAVLVSLAVPVAAGDCLLSLLLPGRSAVTPYGAPVCLLLAAAQWGVTLENRGQYDAFRTAAMDDDPPYLVTDTERGACKQRGSLPGFYTTAMREDASTLIQTVLLPVILVASLV